MVAINAPEPSVSDLERLAVSLEKLTFPRLPGERSDHETRDRLVRAIRSYLLPRMQGLPSPLLVVFCGPTGSGKSTLLNSISGLRLSETGPLRPTTRAPVVLASNPDRYRLIGGVDCLAVSGKAPILGSVALVDTPDIDSTALSNRAAAEILIDHADVVVLVVSALRYADLAAWEVLRRARSRGAPILVVLNRVGASSAGAPADFRRLLREEGIDEEPIQVHEHHLGPTAMAVPSVAARGLRRRLLLEVERNRLQRDQITRNVLWSTLGEAGELIARAEADTTDMEIISGMLDEILAPDLDRIRASFEPGGDDRVLELTGGGLAGLNPRRARRRLRRNGADPAQAGRIRAWLEPAVSGAVAEDLSRARATAAGVVGERRLGGVGRVIRDRIDGAVLSWSETVSTAVIAGQRPELLAPLVMLGVMGEDGAEDVLAAVLGADVAGLQIANAGDSLLRVLRPLYDAERGSLLSVAEATPRPLVDDARVAVTEAVALSAFANA